MLVKVRRCGNEPAEIVAAVRDYSQQTLVLEEDEYLVDPRLIHRKVSVVSGTMDYRSRTPSLAGPLTASITSTVTSAEDLELVAYKIQVHVPGNVSG